jgi:ribosomal protein L37AE/L43A
VNLTVTHPRERHGCDRCHREVGTEQFVGFCGHQIWLCRECFQSMTDWTEEEIAEAERHKWPRSAPERRP